MAWDSGARCGARGPAAPPISSGRLGIRVGGAGSCEGGVYRPASSPLPSAGKSICACSCERSSSASPSSDCSTLAARDPAPPPAAWPHAAAPPGVAGRDGIVHASAGSMRVDTTNLSSASPPPPGEAPSVASSASLSSRRWRMRFRSAHAASRPSRTSGVPRACMRCTSSAWRANS
eukprot:364076-Chlamydomonas_euryale.AAC.7